MADYTTNAKQVLRDGRHYADAVDERAAQNIAEALNYFHLDYRDETPDFFDTQQSLELPRPRVGDRFTIDLEGNTYSGTFGECHRIERQADEFACSCGKRWDASDGENHP